MIHNDETHHSRVSGVLGQFGRVSGARVYTDLRNHKYRGRLNTEGERCKEGRKGVPMVEKYGQEGRMEGNEREG